MTMTDPITPPPELLQLWFEQHYAYNKGLNELLIEVARYGADEELEACCEWLQLNYNYPLVNHPLRTARRPKPPSLKERSLQLLETYNTSGVMLTADQVTIIRRALEALPND
jgi:hypothetical protein